MGDHFSAFSFVDRIRGYTRRGPHARGFFTIPEGLDAFPSCLVAEAVGQLASWVAMDHIDFRGRPVAALALETRFLRDVKPGETLELGVELESCDDEAVSYRGWADVDGARALELIDCLGPMLPLDEFDSPLVLRERFDVLCGAGAPAGRFHGINGFRVEPGRIVPGKSASATLYVPEAAPFFHDHFPRRPVFPATLLLNEMIQLALNAAGSNGGGNDDGAGTHDERESALVHARRDRCSIFPPSSSPRAATPSSRRSPRAPRAGWSRRRGSTFRGEQRHEFKATRGDHRHRARHARRQRRRDDLGCAPRGPQRRRRRSRSSTRVVSRFASPPKSRISATTRSPSRAGS